MNKQLATLILAASKCYEDNYDRKAADKATAEADKEKEKDPENPYVGFVNYKEFYKLTLQEACIKVAGNEHDGYPIYLLLFQTWNDAIDWACKELNTTVSEVFNMKSKEPQ